mgnify:CR=1 FL=1
MSIISKIRERTGLLIVLIGVALLAFIVGDFFRTGSSMFGGRDVNNAIGEIAGDPVSPQTYSRYIDKAEEAFVLQNGQASLTPEVRDQLRDQAWNTLVLETLLEKERSGIQLNVTGEELFYVIQGPNPPQSIVQAFSAPGEAFDPQRVRNFLANINNIDNPQLRQQWLRFERDLRDQRLRNKYFDLVRKAYFVTDVEAEQAYKAKNQTLTVDYAYANTNSIPDSAVQVSQLEIEAYYDENKARFEQEPNRDFLYVKFDVIPTVEDTQSALQQAQEIAGEFESVSRDSVFMRLNSDEPVSAPFQGPGQLQPDSLSEKILAADSGSVFGPYLQAGRYTIYKVMGFRQDSQPRFHVQHIFMRPKSQDEAAYAALQDTMQRLRRQIKRGASFDSLARLKSEDRAARSGGNLGWFRANTRNRQVPFAQDPQFIDGLKNLDSGDVATVRSRQGVHLVKMLDDPSYQLVQVGTIIRDILPGDDTYTNAYQRASEFRRNVNGEQDFRDQAREMGVNIRIAQDIEPSARNLPGMRNARTVISWAFNAQANAVSDILDADQRYVIAVLTSVDEAPYQKLEEVREDILSELLLEAKREVLAERFRQAKTSQSTLQAMAQAVEGQTRIANQVNLDQANLPGVGRAPKLIGYASGLPLEQIAGPVGEARTVFMVRLQQRADVSLPESLADTRRELLQPNLRQVPTDAFSALRELADVKDMRYRL